MLSLRLDYSIVLIFCIYNMFILSIAKRPLDSRMLAMCDVRHHTSTQSTIQCNVSRGQLFDYRDLRQWSEKESSKYSVTISCDGGIVYLPWPFKAKHVISLEVNRCKVFGFLTEMTTHINIADELKMLILSDVTVEIPVREMILLRERVNMIPKSTDCGQLTLEKLVLRNVHFDLKMSPEERDGIQPVNFGGKVRHDSVTHQEPCIYKNLKYIDESGSRKSGQYYLKLIPEYSKFPALEVYNMSGNEMDHVPDSFRHLHSGKFPVLRHIDFSNNFLRKFEFDLPKQSKTCRLEILNLHNNQINSIPSAITQKLKHIGSIFVDLRQNPLRCGCRLAPFGQYLDSQYQKASNNQQRKMITDITCVNGSNLHRKLKRISILKANYNKKCQR